MLSLLEKVIALFKTIQPANTEFRKRKMLILWDIWPNLLCFLNQKRTANITVLTLYLLLPFEEYIFKDRPIRSSLTVGG